MNQDGRTNYNQQKPVWFNESLIAGELDLRPLVAAGEHPVGQVIAGLTQLEKGKIYKLIAPFLPAPLIDKASNLNFDHWVSKEGEDTFAIYFISEQN